MSGRFEWREVTTIYRDVLASGRGDELRWLLNRERIADRATGETVTRTVIRHPGVCVIVPFLADDRIVLIRQFRHSVRDELWELPAGTINGREEDSRAVATETPAACAARELREETGYEAAEWEPVASYFSMPGSNDAMTHLFFARRLVERTQSLDEGEAITGVRAFAISELEGMLRRGEVRDGKTLIGLFHALARRPGGLGLS